MISIGFDQGVHCPVVFVHPFRGLEVEVHGDDFTGLGERSECLWFSDKMKERYEIKLRGIFGGGPTDDKVIRILNRIMEWQDEYTSIEGDPRHAEIMVNELQLTQAKPVVTPGASQNNLDAGTALDARTTSQYRSLTMRGAYLAQDRAEIQFATKELARRMKNPTTGSWEGLKRLGRFLLGKPRSVLRYYDQAEVSCLKVFADSDDAGCKLTRKSTSSGYLYHGGHLLRGYSVTQALNGFSSGESEFYSASKGCAVLLGAKSMVLDLGHDLRAELHLDASAAKSIIERRGTSTRTKHIHRAFLWIQQRFQMKEFSLHKCGTKDNTADLGTKYLEWPVICHLCELAGIYFEDVASKLALKA
jgi:hypothetical protein